MIEYRVHSNGGIHTCITKAEAMEFAGDGDEIWRVTFTNLGTVSVIKELK